MSSPQVYGLMGNRLRKRCATLHISDELRLKIWTCFEHSLVHCSDLFVDRQLDQLLMCAIYIIAKVSFDLSALCKNMGCHVQRGYYRQDILKLAIYLYVLTQTHKICAP